MFRSDKQYKHLFKQEFADYLNVPSDRLFLFGAGRMGLFSFLKSLNLKTDEEVILPAYTCVVVPNAIAYAGAKVKYVDVDIRTTNINTQLLLKSITDKTRAIIVSHNFGITFNDIDLIKTQFPNVVIIEDAAHALGSVFSDNAKVGTKGDAAFFSFEYSKPITTGMGGLLVINNEAILTDYKKNEVDLPEYSFWNRIRIFKTLSTHFVSAVLGIDLLKRALFYLVRKMGLLYASSQKELNGEFPEQYPVALSNSFAYVGFRQIKKLYAIDQHKKELSLHYYNFLKKYPSISLYHDKQFVMARFPILFREEVGMNMITDVISKLKAGGIDAGDWFNDVVHPRGSHRHGYIENSCPEGEYLAKRMINLPLTIHSRRIDKVLKTLKESFQMIAQIND
ncbi:MAG TPA: DegT/DnrJ/EryC1/StrS family aminotransferase [Bacteroidia bacterium]|nr:DegT/DnrJ/EryC1/StrS family aminotransferase [Bacteroidia bacterium]